MVVPSYYNQGYSNQVNPAAKYKPPPGADPVKIPNVSPTIKDKYGRDQRRPNYANTQILTEQLGKLDEKYNLHRKNASRATMESFEGISGYKFSLNPDGSLKVEQDATTRKGWKENEAVEQAQGGLGNAVYSSSARKQVGEALSNFGKYAANTLSTYATSIAQMNEDQNQTSIGINRQINDYITADAQWLVNNPPERPPDWMAQYGDVKDTPVGGVAQLHLSYGDRPDEDALKQMYPGFDFHIFRGPIENGVEGWITHGVRRAPGAAPGGGGGGAAPDPTRVAEGPSQGEYRATSADDAVRGDPKSGSRYEGDQWTGSGPPNKQSLAKRWGIKPAQVGITQRVQIKLKDGRVYVVAAGAVSDPQSLANSLGVNPGDIGNVSTVYIARPKKGAR